MDGAECFILTPDNGINVVAQPIIYDKKLKEVNTRFIGTKDPNGLLDNKYISEAKLGDFFFMLKGGE